MTLVGDPVSAATSILLDCLECLAFTVTGGWDCVSILDSTTFTSRGLTQQTPLCIDQLYHRLPIAVYPKLNRSVALHSTTPQ